MNGKKARRLRKEHGVKHVRLIGKAEETSRKNEEAKSKRRAELRRQKGPLFESRTVIPPTEQDVRRYGER